MTSEVSTLSAAEKAELRRQKVLAKKNARIAYAAGDRSTLPSAAPTEEIQVSISRQPSDSVTARQAPRSELPFARLATAQPDGITPINARARGSSVVDILRNALFRGALLGITAIIFALSVHRGLVRAWRISAVEVFACAELCLSLPRVMISAQNLLEQSRGGGSLGLLWFLSLAQEAYSAVNGFLFDFSAFMVCFLYTWSVVTK